MMLSGMSAREEQPATVPPPAGEDDAYNATTKVGAMPAEIMARLRAEGLLPDEDDATMDAQPVTAPPPPLAPRPRPVVPGGQGAGDAEDNDDENVPALYSMAPPVAIGPSGAPASGGAGIHRLEDLEESEKTAVADLSHLRIETPGVERMPEGIVPIAASSQYDPHQSSTAPPPKPPSASPMASQPRMGTAPVAFPPVGATPPSSLHPMNPIVHSSRPPIPPPTSAPPQQLAAISQAPPLMPVIPEELTSGSLDSKALGRSRLSKGALLGLVLALMVVVIAALFIRALISQRR